MTAGPGRRATAADVARLAGVSTATVSYVLNEAKGRRIPEATRERVQAAARSLDYQPNTYARALASGTSQVALLELSDIPYGDVVGRLTRAVAAELDDSGYLPVLDTFDRGHDAPHPRLHALAGLLAPALVVTFSPLPAQVQASLRLLGVQRFLSLVGAPDPLEGIARAAEAQVRHLHERGHTRIGYVGTAEVALAAYDEARRAGAASACAALGATSSHVSWGGDINTVREDMRQAMAQPGAPTAVAAYNDEVAFTVLGAAHQLDLSVPRDMAVIGTDDTALAASAVPALTTVRQSYTELGSLAEALADSDRLSVVPADSRLAHDVVQRAST